MASLSSYSSVAAIKPQSSPPPSHSQNKPFSSRPLLQADLIGDSRRCRRLPTRFRGKLSPVSRSSVVSASNATSSLIICGFFFKGMILGLGCLLLLRLPWNLIRSSFWVCWFFSLLIDRLIVVSSDSDCCGYEDRAFEDYDIRGSCIWKGNAVWAHNKEGRLELQLFICWLDSGSICCQLCVLMRNGIFLFIMCWCNNLLDNWGSWVKMLSFSSHFCSLFVSFLFFS